MAIEIKYDEPKIGDAAQVARLEDLHGFFPRVTSAPTWKPRSFIDSIAFYANGATYRLYIYDFINSAWRYSSLT